VVLFLQNLMKRKRKLKKEKEKENGKEKRGRLFFFSLGEKRNRLPGEGRPRTLHTYSFHAV